MINLPIKKIKKRILRSTGSFFIDSGNPEHTIFLAGSGRSGTTWIQEVVNHDNSFRLMFEPFHSELITQIKHWNYRQYLRATNKDEKYFTPTKEILSGNIRHKWIDQFNSKRFVNKRFIKDIRANLILNWIHHNFPQIPIILILRHPCAVANSKLKLGWDTHLDNFLEQEDLVNDYLFPFKSLIEQTTDLFEKHILMWCIENYIPLKQFKKGEILLLFYEDICTNADREINRIASYLKHNISPKVINMINSPSFVSRKESAVNLGEDLLTKWKEEISENQLNSSIEILKHFKLEKLYNKSIIPLVNAEEVLDIIN